MIYAFASWPHYLDHLAPITAALPSDVFAGTYTPKTPGDLPSEGLWLVAGHSDLDRLRPRRTVYVEHGAGQTYTTPHPTYPGGPGNDTAVLFVCPRREVAARWEQTYPGVQTVSAGCPKLDAWHGMAPPALTAAFTFHHNAQVCPESNSAWSHYRKQVGSTVRDLTAAGVRVLAHAHPRWRASTRRWWDGTGAEWVDHLGDIFDQASLLVADNTSALPEFAALGRPVVWLNAPWYRRDVHHGGRFWDWPTGQITCDHPSELTQAVVDGFEDRPQVADSRARMVRSVYDHTDGHAAERAATAILEVYGC